MGITVLKHNVPWGPFTPEQIRECLERGDFDLQAMAHARGLKEWQPLGEVLQYLEHGTLPPPVPALPNLPPTPPMAVAPKIPKMPPPLSPRPPAMPATPPRMPQMPAAPSIEPKLVTAPFVSRFIAFLIDCGVLFVPIVVLFVVGAITIEIRLLWERADAESSHQQWLLLQRNFNQLVILVAVVLAWLYAAGLECSRWQATVGKQWMGLKVTDLAGERLSFFRATGRLLAKYLSALPCFLGFIMALFSSRGSALHDRVAGTRVIKN